jgi:G3E family GTPase
VAFFVLPTKIAIFLQMVTDYIAKEVLRSEGFIHISDMDDMMSAAFGTVPAIVDRRMDVPDIARWLQVSIYRLRGYINDNEQMGVRILDKDGRLSIRQITRMDWRRLTEQKRTCKMSGSDFQGKKRKKSRSC